MYIDRVTNTSMFHLLKKLLMVRKYAFYGEELRVTTILSAMIP